MYVEYEMTINDFVAAELRVLDRSMAVRRWIRNAQFLGAGLLAAAIVCFAFLIGGAAGLLVGVPIAIVLAAMQWFLVPRASRHRFRQRLTQFYEGSDRNSLLGPRYLKITEAGIVSASPLGETMIRWSAVTGVVVKNRRCFIDFAGGVFVIPLRTYSDSQSQELLHDIGACLEKRESGSEVVH